jgi:hypothetical protein
MKKEKLLHLGSLHQHLYLTTIGLFFHDHSLLHHVVVSVSIYYLVLEKIEFWKRRNNKKEATQILTNYKQVKN